jgi:hypothetical protein
LLTKGILCAFVLVFASMVQIQKSHSNSEVEPQLFNNFVIFQTEEGKVNVDVFFYNDTLWMTQKTMAELFEVEINTINYHLKNIFESNELEENSVIREIRITASDGKKYLTKFYSLDAIIAVGYRINSKRATKFRIWATKVLHNFIIKGFVLDDERLKQIQHFGKDYFQELLDRIREIRSSERRFYQKITDIFALAADYDKDSHFTKEFFASVQNKLHWAISGKTAAEIIYHSADASQPNMGLKTWKRSPGGKILKGDVTVAKNYLDEDRIKQLERLVSSYLDLAESRATRGLVTNMKDWSEFLNRFLVLSEYPVLDRLGAISAEEARIKAEGEYEKFRMEQDMLYQSDFDKEIERILSEAP